MRKLVVTIDGPVASGKSTLAKIVAEKVGYVFLSTGLLYRAVAFKAALFGVDNFDDEEAMLRVTLGQTYTFRVVDGKSRLFLDMVDRTDEVGKDKYSIISSKVSRHQKVRKALLDVQQRMGKVGGVVAEGRDTGRIVFPDADLKFFLVADLDFRARMRYGDILNSGITDVSIDQVREEIEQRDAQDMEGENASLQYTDSMIRIDTTEKDLRVIAHNIVTTINLAPVG